MKVKSYVSAEIENECIDDDRIAKIEVPDHDVMTAELHICIKQVETINILKLHLIQFKDILIRIRL